MARKGREPLVEAPPPAASSSEEELSDDDDDEPEQQRHSSSGEEEEEADETPPSSPAPAKKAPTHKKPDPPKPAHESDSESETDSDVPPAKVKPIESKPMDAGNMKKPRSKPAGATAPVTVLASPAPTTVTKRRGGSDTDKGTPAKKAKREKVEGAQDEGKKPLFQRLWSEDDEVVILEGMIDYKGKKGVDPMADADNFLEFIKKSLHVDVNRAQIMSKVRTLKKRFENAKKKKKIVDPHGVRLFELSKKIWENDGVKSNGGGVDSKDSNLKPKKKVGVEKLKGAKDVNGSVSEDEEEEEEKLQDWMISRRDREVKLEDLGDCGFLKDGFLKEGMKLLDEEEKAKLGEKWKKHNLEEMEVYLKRLDLIKELTQKTLNAIKSA